MKIHLEELEHQKEALDALMAAVQPLCRETSGNQPFANPLLEEAGNEKFFIDIKMETGTGKTYVYTRTMYELNKCLGLFKFIIVVPSLAIKEGTGNFVRSDYASQHFARFYPNKRIDLQMVSGGDFAGKRGRRKNLPASLVHFCEAERSERNIIQCMLINTQMLISKGFRDDTYDQTLFGDASSPLEAVRETRPIVIIDEPHRVKRGSAGYEAIKALDPQLIIRFGATFPETRTGRGLNAIAKPDYYRNVPQYDLGAVEAFNNDLVKGVSVQFPNLEENAASRFRVSSVTAKELVLTRRADNQPKSTEFRIQAGEDLGAVTAVDFGNVSYQGGKLLSNELELATGMESVAGVFNNTYQESMLSQALDEHFKIEQENFERSKGYKVKTNALFFIDSIESYRNPDGWLKETFARSFHLTSFRSHYEGECRCTFCGGSLHEGVEVLRFGFGIEV